MIVKAENPLQRYYKLSPFTGELDDHGNQKDVPWPGSEDRIVRFKKPQKIHGLKTYGYADYEKQYEPDEHYQAEYDLRPSYPSNLYQAYYWARKQRQANGKVKRPEQTTAARLLIKKAHEQTMTPDPDKMTDVPNELIIRMSDNLLANKISAKPEPMRFSEKEANCMDWLKPRMLKEQIEKPAQELYQKNWQAVQGIRREQARQAALKRRRGLER